MQKLSKSDGAKARLHFVTGRFGAWVDPEDIHIPEGGNFIQLTTSGKVDLEVSVFYVAFIEYATKEEYEKLEAADKKAKQKGGSNGTDI